MALKLKSSVSGKKTTSTPAKSTSTPKAGVSVSGKNLTVPSGTSSSTIAAAKAAGYNVSVTPSKSTSGSASTLSPGAAFAQNSENRPQLKEGVTYDKATGTVTIAPNVQGVSDATRNAVTGTGRAGQIIQNATSPESKINAYAATGGTSTVLPYAQTIDGAAPQPTQVPGMPTGIPLAPEVPYTPPVVPPVQEDILAVVDPFAAPVPGSADSLLAGESAYEKAQREAYEASQAPIDENAIRKQKEAEYQAQLESINKLYADRLNQARIQGQGRLGSSTAMQARGGLLGSDFGAAQTAGVQGYNVAQENTVEMEKQANLNEVYSLVQQLVTQEVTARKLAKSEGAKAWIEFLKDEPARKAEKTGKLAQLLLMKNLGTKDVSDAALKAAGITRSDLELYFYSAKKSADQEAAAAASAAETASLGRAKTQAEINEINYKASKNYEEGGIIYNAQGQQIGIKQGNNYEAGGKIYEAGTNKYLGEAVKPGTTGGVVTGGVVRPSGSYTTVQAGNKNVVVDSVAAAGLTSALSALKAAGLPVITGQAKRDQAQTIRDMGNRVGMPGATAAELRAAGHQIADVGQSNHETGLAIDLYGDNNLSAPTPQQIAIMEQNGWKHSAIPGDMGHFEYVGGTGGSEIDTIAQGSKGGRSLPPNQSVMLSDATYFPELLNSLETSISENSQYFDPLKGLYYSANPYETGAQSIEDDLKRSMQLIGKFMEGGVLRKEDEIKYAKMLPKLTDTYDVAQNKLQGIRKMLADKYNGYIRDFANSGYDVSKFATIDTSVNNQPTGTTQAGTPDTGGDDEYNAYLQSIQ